MFSPTIKQLLAEKNDTFIIPVAKIAFVQANNPLYHAFLILTRVKYAKIPVLDQENHVVGLISLAMITATMMGTHEITSEPLNSLKVCDVMETNFDKINLSESTLESQLHLLIDNPFLPVVDNHDIFQGLLTRRKWIKAFNYITHNLEKKYKIIKK